MGQPIRLLAWSKAELVVTDRRSLARDDYTSERHQTRSQDKPAK